MRSREGDLRYQLIREYVAAKFAETDAAGTVAMIESISDPVSKLTAIASVAKAIPASERGRKRALLERATTLLRQAPRARWDRHRVVAMIAEQWLDMGKPDRARLVLQAGRQTSSAVFHTGYLGQLRRLDRSRAMARMQGAPDRNDPSYARR